MAGKKEKPVAGEKVKHSGWLTFIMAVISILWISPLFVVLLNSFKRQAYIFRNPFGISSVPLAKGFEKWSKGISRMFVGWLNYMNAVNKTNFWTTFGTSLFITVASVVAIIIFCSMTAWFIARVHTWYTKLIYTLCLFSMVVPFQMVMFTLSNIAKNLHLSNPVGIIVVYLGFGAGLAVFMFTGFVKSIPIEIEEAAMIDGCNPLQTYFKVVFPIMKPTTITVAILDAMWIWNDYLLPSLVLDKSKYSTLPIAVQSLKESYGQVDWGAMMAILVLSIVPIVIFYAFAQKYIIKGVAAGAVKG